ncbi:SCO family protein [Pseudogemmobacter faecipullorum]|uniref:SCO family protein n=1 Tax=Pseudogemmobacter faecipullorum TaxID=2755041 RepID=A0ABS8CSB9_9RHOB|nr:SCO family protein [Pseudogemmobacter faecipullorum]MCB5412300.1 SCO family protein [Pseudogemmobacter faecipullorum]
MSVQRRLLIALWALVVVALGLVAWFLMLSPDRQRAGALEFGRGDYVLQRHDGGAFTQETLIGQPSLVFFGFTHCPDVCPTTIGDILTWQEELGDEAADLRIFFVTVDPERDSPEILADYVGWLPGAVGVTGPVDEIHKAMQAFRIFARKVPTSGGDYSMDHSSSVQLFGADGRFVTHISYQAPLEQALERLRMVLR